MLKNFDPLPFVCKDGVGGIDAVDNSMLQSPFKRTYYGIDPLQK